MTKRAIAKKYLRENVDFEGLRYEWKNSWLADKPKEWLFSNGLVFSYFYDHEKKAVEIAGYKYPSSERTWETMRTIEKELIREKVF